MPLRSRAPILVLILVFGAVVPAAATAGPDLFEGPPLSAPADAIRELSRSVPAGDAAVQVLHESARFEVDASSRVTYRFTAVYRVDTPGAVEGWSEVNRTWRSWYQERPELHARVLTPDGNEHRLDPAHFFRVSRSAIVNLDAVREVEPVSGGYGEVTLASGLVLEVTRRRFKELLRHLGQS